MNPIDFIENYCDWSNPETVWMLKTAVRNKDNDPIVFSLTKCKPLRL